MATNVEKQDPSARLDVVGSAGAEELRDPAWAWAAYEPDARRPWTLALAAHLYRRAGFGADWKQLQQALADGPQRTIDRLLRPQADVDAFNRTYDDYESIAGSVAGLRAWWLRRMMETPQPLLEKMTLFWHGHLAASAAGLKDPRLMQQHVQLLRSGALGSFSDLLHAVSRDPAMLLSLGADANRKVRPNEKFVRPLMESFTLGPGAFTDRDVHEAARAFTGWFVLRGQLRYFEREHDDGAKRVLGREGEFGAEDVVRIVLEQPATSRTLVRKLFRWLISEAREPDEALIAPLAESFARDDNVSELVGTMLRSNAFFSELSYRQRIKCPVEFALGMVRALEGVVSTTHLAQDVADLGQDLCHPPTVKGWPGGRCWISTATLAGRGNLALALLRNGDPYGGKLDPCAVARQYGYATSESAAQFLIDLFFQGDLGAEVRDAVLEEVRASATDRSVGPGVAMRRFVHVLATLPEFHLA